LENPEREVKVKGSEVFKEARVAGSGWAVRKKKED